MFCKVFVRSLLVAVVAFGMASLVNADTVVDGQMDSSAFSWKYDMSVLPSTQDLDSNGTNDFTLYAGDGSATTDGNVLRMVNSKSNGNGFFASDSVGQIWANQGLQLRRRIYGRGQSQDHLPGHRGRGRLPNCGESNRDRRMGSSGDFEYRRVVGFAKLGRQSTTDDFHVYRFVQQDGAASYAIWRDGVQLTTEMLLP